jgi:hypothetical protein
MIRLLAACFCALIFCGSAEARQRHKSPAHDPACNVTMPCDFSYGPEVFKESRRVARGEAVAKAVGFGAVRIRASHESSNAALVPSQVIGGRPAGCPHAFCGCSASLQVFGRIVPSLNLAANWLRFPRAAPSPGMVAARSGHVFVLKEHLGGNVWLAHDGNSGGHLTRLHPRSIAGFTVVNPHGAS